MNLHGNDRRSLWWIVVVGLLWCCTACQTLSPLGQTFPVEVRRVVSGQTVEARFPEGITAVVRLGGINAPDWRQEPWGPASKETLTQLIDQTQQRGETISLELAEPEPDGYGRYWGYLWRGKRLLNRELLERGQGLVDLTHLPPRYQEAFGRSQAYGRIMGYGIWDPSQPLRQTPQEFRAQQENE